MKYIRILAVMGVLLVSAGFAHAQRFSVGIGVGPVYGGPVYVGGPPVCRYGYYGYYPYACAPYGYYGPEWFSGGVFIGAGPWYRGFYGRPGFYRDHEFYEHREFRHDWDDRGHGWGREFHDRDDRRFHDRDGDRFHDRGFHDRGDFHDRGEFHDHGRR